MDSNELRDLLSQITPGTWGKHPHYNFPLHKVPAGNGYDEFEAANSSLASGEKIIAQFEMETGIGGWPVVGSVNEMEANLRLAALAPSLARELIAARECLADAMHCIELGCGDVDIQARAAKILDSK